MSGYAIQAVFSKNRTEELGNDVWEQFVIPPFYDRLDLRAARKPRVVVGGRGCGKTMLLRYLSHQTMFSPARRVIPADAIEHIGLYWRADTHFLNMMFARGIAEDIWHSAFVHMAAVVLGMELLASLRSIAESSHTSLNVQRLASLNFRRLGAFDDGLPTELDSLFDALQTRLWELEAWVNDVRKAKEPKFLAGEKFVQAMLSEIKAQVHELGQANYFVYLDEYENLRPYQQRIVNTWLKHSEIPLIFNLAMKRNGMDTQETTGPESLSDLHDFRTHDLEHELESDFPLFAAEILFLHLALANQKAPIDPDVLRDPARLRERRQQEYADRVRSSARELFPGLTQEEMATAVFRDSALSNKLAERIRKALSNRSSQLTADAFIRPEFPEASIVAPALLHRRALTPELIKGEFEKLHRGEENDFTGKRSWIHNNFVGSYLQLYEPYSRACPFYAGFQAFCQLAHGNLRYFLELCHKSLSRLENLEFPSAIDPLVQADAAREASAAFLREVRSYGPRGLQLYTFVLRLGSLFAIAHQRPTQSEPEQTHFSIGAGSQPLAPQDHSFLREAVKWSVLYEEEETKKKSSADPEDIEYILAPIYSPYFHISYRKRRKMNLTIDDFLTLERGTYDEVKDLLKRYSAAWSVQSSDLAPTLFSHLEQGA